MGSTPEGGDSLTHAAGARSVATLSRDLADFLVEFSIVLHKRAMYPLGHPHLQESTARFVNRLESLLAPRESLAIGIARQQLIVAGTATDPRNALLSDLARRFHRHRIATVRFERGVGLQEIDDLLAGVAADPQGEAGPFGLRPDAGAAWVHLRIQPPELSRMFLQDDDEPAERPETPAGALWLGLAHLALSGDGSPTDDAEDPLLVARAIDAQPEQVAYDRVVLDYLGQIADEMSGRQGAWEPRIRERVSRLVTSLKPETLRRVLEAGCRRRRAPPVRAHRLAGPGRRRGDRGRRGRGGHERADHLAPAASPAAQVRPSRRERPGTACARRRSPRFARTSRSCSRSGRWKIPNPGAYTAVLEGMVRQSPQTTHRGGAEQLDCEPERLLQLALELDCVGPRVDAALDALDRDQSRPGRARPASRSARPSASATAETLWRRLATPGAAPGGAQRRPTRTSRRSRAWWLDWARWRPSRCSTCSSGRRSPPSAAARSACWSSIGPSVAPAAVARLKDAPWYVQRNVLALLRTLHVWPPDFSAVTLRATSRAPASPGGLPPAARVSTRTGPPPSRTAWTTPAPTS